MGTRRNAREAAIKVLYQMDLMGQEAETAFDLFCRHYPPADEARSFARQLCIGVAENKAGIDELLEECSEHWSLGRMAIVDRNIMRLAVFEIRHCPDIPDRVTINEAIELAKLYGAEESGGFINGILDRIAKKGQREEG